jgi:asparagine synthase (glutamine-hydrolysing)
MSIIFGVRRPKGDFVEEQYLVDLAHATDRYAPDGTFISAKGRLGMAFQPYYTHERSNLESQPLADSCGNMLVFDGRVDNAMELSGLLNIHDKDTPDSAFVLAAFERWGEDCFSHLIGDWALALWSVKDQALYLARDHAGTRSLYYEINGDTLTWATYLETFLADGRTRELDQVYAACYLAVQPTRDATPYKELRAVTPAHYLKVQGAKVSQRAYWTSMPQNRIQYRNDAEYEEHFVALFKQSVERRTGPGAPILAELSGGMDSTSIVCMSDFIRKQNSASPIDLIDTVSYYDDSEPDWNERPFFRVVERQRGKRGTHIDTSSNEASYEPPAGEYLLPGPDSLSLHREREIDKYLNQKDYRIILSGIGGDELLGGPPSPLPELADYAFCGRFRILLRQALAWSLQSRTPLIYTLAHTARFISGLYPTISPRLEQLPPWVPSNLRRIYATLDPWEFRRVTVRLLPSIVDGSHTWWNMLETLPHRYQTAIRRREYRYPYLDRDLVDYLLRVPPTQILKPGRRRYLMRHAMRGIVPFEIIERKRKAFVSKGPMSCFLRERDKMISLFADSELSQAHLVRAGALQAALHETNSQSILRWLPALRRAIQLELWLEGQRSRKETSSTFMPGSETAIRLCVEGG